MVDIELSCERTTVVSLRRATCLREVRCGWWVERSDLVLIVLGHPGLALLVDQQDELDRHRGWQTAQAESHN